MTEIAGSSKSVGIWYRSGVGDVSGKPLFVVPLESGMAALSELVEASIYLWFFPNSMGRGAGVSSAVKWLVAVARSLALGTAAVRSMADSKGDSRRSESARASALVVGITIMWSLLLHGWRQQGHWRNQGWQRKWRRQTASGSKGGRRLAASTAAALGATAARAMAVGVCEGNDGRKGGVASETEAAMSSSDGWRWQGRRLWGRRWRGRWRLADARSDCGSWGGGVRGFDF